MEARDIAVYGGVIMNKAELRGLHAYIAFLIGFLAIGVGETFLAVVNY